MPRKPAPVTRPIRNLRVVGNFSCLPGGRTHSRCYRTEIHRKVTNTSAECETKRHSHGPFHQTTSQICQLWIRHEKGLSFSLFHQRSELTVSSHRGECGLAVPHIACLNSAITDSPDREKQVVFARLLVSLTEYHVKLHLALNDPKSYFPDNESRERAFPDIERNRDF